MSRHIPALMLPLEGPYPDRELNRGREGHNRSSIACDLPACRYIFEVSATLGHTQHLSLGFEPVIKRVAVCVPSFFVQLISAFVNSAFQFSETHLAEIGRAGLS